jgi:hypothetical protein
VLIAMEDLTAFQLAFQNILFFTIGAFIAGYGLQILQSYGDEQRKMKSTSGVVLRCALRPVVHDPRAVAFSIDVEFQTDNGVRRRVTRTVWSNYGVVYEKGEHVRLWYHPDWPENAVLDNPRSRYTGAAIAACAGIFMMILAVIYGWPR